MTTDLDLCDRPWCPDCTTPASAHLGRGRWLCRLCERGFTRAEAALAALDPFPAPGLNRRGERILSSMEAA